MGQHDFDFDPEDALAEQDVTNGSIDVLLRRVTAVNHQPASGNRGGKEKGGGGVG